jgi:hypothetical protein
MFTTTQWKAIDVSPIPIIVFRCITTMALKTIIDE